MNYKQLALNRYVLEQVTEGKKPSVSNDEKVDLDYMANYYNNMITEVEKEMKKKPNAKVIFFRVGIEIPKI